MTWVTVSGMWLCYALTYELLQKKKKKKLSTLTLYWLWILLFFSWHLPVSLSLFRNVFSQTSTTISSFSYIWKISLSISICKRRYIYLEIMQQNTIKQMGLWIIFMIDRIIVWFRNLKFNFHTFPQSDVFKVHNPTSMFIFFLIIIQEVKKTWRWSD